jgi:hypothetical protein
MRITPRPYPVLFLTLFPLLGCFDDPESTLGVAVSDSAGVTLVHNGESTIVDAPPVLLEEVIRIGTLDGSSETQFFQISDAVETEGEIFVLDRGNHEVRVFDTDGQFIRAFGGEGDGPSEFRQPWDLAIIRDTVSVLGARLTMLDRQGNAVAAGPGRMFSDTAYLSYTMATQKGWMGAWSTRKAANVPRGSPFRETTTIYRVDPLSAALGDSLFSYEHAETRLAGAAGWYINPFFQAAPMHAIGPDGNIYYTPGDTYRIDMIDGGTGRLVRRITGDLPLPPVTDALVEQALKAERDRVKDYPPGSEMAMYAEIIDDIAALRTPSTLPVFGRMYASDSGWLLALRQDLDEDPVNMGNESVWDLFDGEGQLRGRVRLSPEHRVLALTDDGLLAVLRDEMDVQSLVRYRFVLENAL